MGGCTCGPGGRGVNSHASSRSTLPSSSGIRLHKRKAVTLYQLRARVGPFECNTLRRFSDFLRLHASLQQHYGKRRSLQLETPTIKKLTESKISIASRERQVESRTRLLQRYCAELCASPELAHHELVTSFFWPAAEDGCGSVVAPDGSMASMIG
uniref:PX domain-containing protein n=1 Tax=Haptolina brevifila TaxID=156173 RepID=A0A7S2D0V3_9EUKA